MRGDDVDHPIIRRALAHVIDFFVLAIPNFIAFLLLNESNGGSVFLPHTLAIAVLYFTISASKYASGRSVGKRVFRIQVVNEDGQFIGIARALLRSVPVAILTNFMSIMMYATDHYEPDSLILRVIALGIIFLIFGTLYFAVFKLNRQSLHDLIASTQVVELNSAVKTTKNLTAPLVFGFIALFAGLVWLSFLD